MPAETSHVFTEVFKTLLDEGTTKRQVAEELMIYPDELNRAIFGLTLMPVEGNGDPEITRDSQPLESPPQLKLL